MRETLSTETSKAIKPVGSDLTTQPIDASSATTTKSLQNEALPNTESNGAKKTASSPTKRNKTMQSMHPVKTANTASEWHQYLREEFSNTPLSSAVSLVLQHQAERVFEIPAIVSAIFVDELPKEIGTKARRQVTNILSSGAMKNKWYRGQQGYYSMSRAAVKGSSS